MFIEYLFAGDKFFSIVGEEDDSVVNILETRKFYELVSFLRYFLYISDTLRINLTVLVSAFTVDDLVVPDEFEDLVSETLAKVKALSSRIDANAYKDLTVFVDPIDVSYSLYCSCYRFSLKYILKLLVAPGNS
jgi:hypothetical protein